MTETYDGKTIIIPTGRPLNVVSLSLGKDSTALLLMMLDKVTVVDDMALKTRVFDENSTIKNIYKTPDNPTLKLFYIDVAEVETFSFTEGPKSYKV